MKNFLFHSNIFIHYTGKDSPGSIDKIYQLINLYRGLGYVFFVYLMGADAVRGGIVVVEMQRLFKKMRVLLEKMQGLPGKMQRLYKRMQVLFRKMLLPSKKGMMGAGSVSWKWDRECAV
jgi:hypothetical protein